MIENPRLHLEIFSLVTGTDNQENIQAVSREWFKEWEREHWAKDTPERPLTREEQERVNAFYPQVIDALEARHITDEADRQRAISNWAGESAFIRLYEATEGDDRTGIILALGKVIESAEKHPGTSAQAIDIVIAMDLTQVESRINKLSKTPIAQENELLRSCIVDYKTHRAFRTLTYKKTREIYQRLTSTSSQAPQ